VFTSGGVLLIIVSDNVMELTSRATLAWRQERDLESYFFVRRKPLQNALVESLNRRFRNECLDEHSFRGLNMAQRIIEAWWLY
jgi:putative transposase